MAMNKKEQAEMQELRDSLAIAKAFRFTELVIKDVPPSSSWEELSTGWTYNPRSRNVMVACSNSIHHGIGRTDETNRQKPLWLYSSKLLALKALRNELERKFAEELVLIDKQIEEEQTKGADPE